MINKIESNLENIVNDIEKFYDKKLYSFLTLNGVKLDEETTEIQWIFSKYGKVDDIVIFFVNVKQDVVIPSLTHILPSAIISQMEIVDMFGIEVQDTQKGLYLDEDSHQMPLSSCGI